MSKIAVLDTTLGDNGKGHFSHYFSKNADWCIRFSGANNCGHVIYRDGKKYVHHLLPSADYRTKCKSFLASGMYINLEDLYEEIRENTRDFPDASKSIYVDPDAFVITQDHIDFDRQNNKHIGSTGKGVSPAATAKYARTGARIYNYINDNAEIIKTLKNIGINFVPLLALKDQFIKSNLVFEGAQGSLLDINSGIYPYVTSSDCTVSGIYASGFHFIKLDEVYGMMKPYLTKSGEGPMPTEYFGEEAEKLRKLGEEYGNTTGRARRVGALDLPMLKYGIERGGITALIISKMDILTGQDTIKVCNDYGKNIYSPNDFKDVKPSYTELKGWPTNDFQFQMFDFIKYIENYTNTTVHYISKGTSEKDIVDTFMPGYWI